MEDAMKSLENKSLGFEKKNGHHYYTGWDEIYEEIMNLKQRNEFCCQVVMGVNRHPSIFSKDNIPGFVAVKAACCGLGTLNAEIFCLPIAAYCSNKSDHLFFDLVHPTEAANRISVDHVFVRCYLQIIVPFLEAFNIKKQYEKSSYG
ncbi:hypothetical protein CMV_002190 [Castanea mollissima]|uniref:GDSL esterase/lipase n=1 Tax=Castanea mollissima TaxID=60419 RepID=A0A8J4RJJ7_9ROSI|nr:hypothetical protein CMV_002190 [Castanea mollissima]